MAIMNMIKLVNMLRKYTISNKINSKRLMSNVIDNPKSALFISGERAQDQFVAVIPHLDFNNRLSNLTELEENIRRRRLDFDINQMKDSWEFYNEWNTNKLNVEKNLADAGKQINTFSKLEQNDENREKLEKLKRYRGLLKQELQQVKKSVWKLEDSVIGELLKLPNDLHPQTPHEDENLYTFNKEKISKSTEHLEMGEKLNCLEYRNNLNYFLKNKAALFELAVSDYFVERFNRLGFIRFVNPDFTRSVLAEGVGLPPQDIRELFLLEQTEGSNDSLYLCGGASLFPFCGYHAKHSVPKQMLPVKYIASGRHYCPVTSSLDGLYSVNQSTSVHIFLATHSQEELYQQFQGCINNLHMIFSEIGLNFKIVKQPPHLYKSWDSLRASVQVYSPHCKVFVEVGHISLIDDFISKRLRMCYTDKNTEPFLKIVSGCMVNAQKLLALCLERSQSDLFIPDSFKDYMYA